MQGCVIQIVFRILFGCFPCEKMKATFYKKKKDVKLNIFCVKKKDEHTKFLLNWLHGEPKCTKFLSNFHTCRIQNPNVLRFHLSITKQTYKTHQKLKVDTKGIKKKTLQVHSHLVLGTLALNPLSPY